MKRKPITKELHYCGECPHCTPITDARSLSIEGKPTLGTCPYWTESPNVILSQLDCDMFPTDDKG